MASVFEWRAEVRELVNDCLVDHWVSGTCSGKSADEVRGRLAKLYTTERTEMVQLIVTEGAFTHRYGAARLQPETPALPAPVERWKLHQNSAFTPAVPSASVRNLVRTTEK